MASKSESTVPARVQLSHGAERALSDLRSRREHVKRKAMQDLRGAVEMEARQMSRENFSSFITELNRRIFDLVKSEEPHEKLGGIFAMDALVDVECEESPTFITRFANYLRLILPCNNVATMIMASKVLGHLAQAGGTLTADFVEFEMKRALEGLNSEKRSEHHRLAAVLVCKELAVNAPTLFFMHVPAYIKAIWTGIHDSKQLIREAAIESLRASLHIIAQRDMSVRNKWFFMVFEEAQRGLRFEAVEVIHGSLLVIGELLLLQQVMESQMPEGFKLEKINKTVMRYCDHRDALVRKTVIGLLPVIASIDCDAFRANFAADALAYLISSLKKGNERAVTFLSLSALLHIAGPQLVEAHRQDLFVLVLDGITPTPRKPLVLEAATCIASLAALDPTNVQVQEAMPELIEQMLAACEGNLTPSLIAALSEIARSMPLLHPDIQMKLLDSISFTLQRTPYQPSGTPNYRRIAPLVRGGTPSASAGPNAKGREAAVIQALFALAEFDFSGNQLCEFVEDCVSLFLDDSSPQVRLTAAKTCSRLLLRPGDAGYCQLSALLYVNPDL